MHMTFFNKIRCTYCWQLLEDRGFPILSLLIFFHLFVGCDSSAFLIFEVTGGEELRPLAIVTFDTKLPSGDYVAQDHTGKDAPLQVDLDSRATLVMERVLPNSVTIWKVNDVASGKPRVTADDFNNQILFSNSGRRIAAFHVSTSEMPREDIPDIYLRNGYLHPVWTPNGKIITDDYPLSHTHHHGIWAAWTKTLFQGRNPDFWNMGSGTGRVELSHLNSVWSGSVYAGLRAHHQYIDMTQEEVVGLNEVWMMNTYGNSPNQNIIDLELIQSAATDSTLVRLQHRYGGIGFRGHHQWAGKNGAEFLTSEGNTRQNGHATRARWVHIGGEVDGEVVGITILSHPSNHEAPQPVRIHPTDPFFNFAPSQAGSFEITSEQPITWKYRFVTYDGPHDPSLLEALWQDYAEPLTVQKIRIYE